MIKGTDVYKLNSCNDWYGDNFENQINCSCGKLENTLNTPTENDCKDEEESLKPYCIGKYQTGNVCQVDGMCNLPKCTNLSISNPYFVYYY